MNCRTMADTLKPRNAKEVEDAVRWALGNEKPLEIAGQGTKRTIGRPSQTDLTLDLSGLSGVTLYEPAELVLSARAGTPLSEIETLLAKNNQELAFEPIEYAPVPYVPEDVVKLCRFASAHYVAPLLIAILTDRPPCGKIEELSAILC